METTIFYILPYFTLGIAFGIVIIFLIVNKLKKEPNNPKEKYLEDLDYQKIAKNILKESSEKNISFVTLLNECNFLEDLDKHKTLKAILNQRKNIFFDELVDLLKEQYVYYVRDIKAERKVGEFLSDEDVLLILYNTGNFHLRKILQDANFNDHNSLRVLSIIDEKFLTDDPVIEYFIVGDGMKHWDNPEARPFIDLVLAIMPDIDDENISEEEKTFIKHFEK